MSAFAKLRAEFNTTWTTILVGWNGLGTLSPWPGRWEEFPPLLSRDEVAAFADERLVHCIDPPELDLILELLSLDPRAAGREAVGALLGRLSDLDGSDQVVELRKWRLILLEQLLEEPPQEPLYGLMALTEFWQGFGFPSDSPHEIQGRGNTISPAQYYQSENFQRLLDRHRIWVQNEKSVLKGK